MVRDEADIVEQTITHLLNEGVDLVLVADGRSTDGTRDILQDLKETTGRVEWIDDGDHICRQVHWMNLLASMVGERGAEWVIPFDADEFWISTDDRPLAEVLRSQEAHTGKLFAPMRQQFNRERCFPGEKPLPKAAFRWNPEARIRMGNHDVDGVAGFARRDQIAVREIQFRSLEHFIRKVRDRCERLDPSLPEFQATHYRRLIGTTDEDLGREWDAMVATETVYDPIPTRVAV